MSRLIDWWGPLGFSLSLHAALIGGLAWHSTMRPKVVHGTPLSIAIEASVVDWPILASRIEIERPSSEIAQRGKRRSQMSDEKERKPGPHSQLQKHVVRNDRGAQQAVSAAARSDASWKSQIAASIERAWAIPPTAPRGIECTLRLGQAADGEVLSVEVGACNGDDSVRESIEAAAYRASPLPVAPDPAQFAAEVIVTLRVD